MIMDPNNAIEIVNITKMFRVEVKDPDKKATIVNRVPTKMIERKVIDNLSLNIHKGDVLGILGRNGAGKSTLLSLIAKIMKPDSGTIERSGKIATILELGMGFHLDMSGRENIYLKGELYGFSRSQIDERIDKIIEYSGIKDYIDNPVRTYSSGMSGRLAFAIMVNVDSDIMLVDEILSVGDLSFSAKAREHFKKMASSGKTVVFVSHSIDFVESMCNRVVWLENGKVFKEGPSKQICSEYRNYMNDSPEVISDLAIAGVPDSQYKLGMSYRDGGAFGQSDELYEKWIKEAAIHGHTRAQVEYANILFSRGEEEESIEYYNLAAVKGDVEAKNKISILSLPKSFGIEQLVDIFKQIAKPGSCVNEYRCALLLLKSAWSNKDRKEAFEMFVRAADDGSLEAMNQVAIMYRDGVGTPKDVKKMEEYFQKGAESGHIPSMVALGDIYSQGRYLPKDETKAFNCLLKAAKLGDSNCMYRIANMYKDGMGVSPSKDESDYWLDKYVKSLYHLHRVWAAGYVCCGSVDTGYSVTDLYDDSFGAADCWAIGNLIFSLRSENKLIDKYLDVLLYKAENNNVDAIRRIGNLYYDGIGVKKDYEVAIKWYTKASNLGDSWAKLRLGDMYRDGKGVEIDIKKAITLYSEVAQEGNVAALSNLIMISTSKATVDSSLFERSFEMLKNIAYSGNLDAIKRVGNYYYDGVGVSRDYSEAFYWYEKASLLGDSWAKNRLGEMFRNGIVPKNEDIYRSKDLLGDYDPQKALELFMISTSQKDSDTLYKISTLCMGSEDDALKQLGKTCLILSARSDNDLAIDACIKRGIDYNNESLNSSSVSDTKESVVIKTDENNIKVESDNVEPLLQKLQDTIKEESNQQNKERNMIKDEKKDQVPIEIETVPVKDQVHILPDGCSYKGTLDQNGQFTGFGICT